MDIIDQMKKEMYTEAIITYLTKKQVNSDCVEMVEEYIFLKKGQRIEINKHPSNWVNDIFITSILEPVIEFFKVKYGCTILTNQHGFILKISFAP